MATQSREPWYAAGVQFECQRSGNCCTGAPGHVWLTDDEADAIAKLVKTRPREFRDRYTRIAKGKLSLTERANGDCVFYVNGGCSVYAARPTQCRTWPFWPEVMRSQDAWDRFARECPGMGRGKLRTAQEIERLLDMDK